MECAGQKYIERVSERHLQHHGDGVLVFELEKMLDSLAQIPDRLADVGKGTERSRYLEMDELNKIDEFVIPVIPCPVSKIFSRKKGGVAIS